MPESEKELAKESSDNRIKDADMKDVELAGARADPTKDIIEVREKKGFFRAAIPHANVPIAWLVLFLNVFVPGTGTLILSLCALCGVRTDMKNQNRCVAFLINLATALLQTATAVIIIGWIWSVYWGMYAVTEANEKAEFRKKKLKAEKHSAEEIKTLQSPDDSKPETADNAV